VPELREGVITPSRCRPASLLNMPIIKSRAAGLMVYKYVRICAQYCRERCREHAETSLPVGDGRKPRTRTDLGFLVKASKLSRRWPSGHLKTLDKPNEPFAIDCSKRVYNLRAREEVKPRGCAAMLGPELR
jgi:hypothetical protein